MLELFASTLKTALEACPRKSAPGEALFLTPVDSRINMRAQIRKTYRAACLLAFIDLGTSTFTLVQPTPTFLSHLHNALPLARLCHRSGLRGLRLRCPRPGVGLKLSRRSRRQRSSRYADEARTRR